MENWVSKLIMFLGFPHKNGKGGGNCGYGWGHEMFMAQNLCRRWISEDFRLNDECPKSADQIIW